MPIFTKRHPIHLSIKNTGITQGIFFLLCVFLLAWFITIWWNAEPVARCMMDVDQKSRIRSAKEKFSEQIIL